MAATTTQTQQFELHPLPASPKNGFQASTPKYGSNSDSEQDGQRVLGTSSATTDEIQPPSNAVEALQRWNNPTINMWRVFATFWSFFVLGLNDGSYGALIPYVSSRIRRVRELNGDVEEIVELERYYDLSYTVISLVFLSPFVGYAVAAITNNLMHVHYGQRGVAVFGPLCHVVAFTIMAIHPPYPVLVVMFTIVGFGNGLIDAAWCAWIGNMANANEVSGILQSCYALGATIAPLISTTMFTKGGLPWYSFYYLILSASAVELLTSSWTFWAQTGAVYQSENPMDTNKKTGRTREALNNKITYIFSIFIFGYMGAEISLGGWIVKFMTTVRKAPEFESGMTATGFWAGMTIGRLFLPFVTKRIGEFHSVLLYLALSIGLELLFWLVPSFILSAVAVAFLGFFFGPMFPTAIVLTTKLTPRRLHVGTIGFGTAIGGSGGAIFPFLVGVIAQHKGVKTLQPVILALLAAIAGFWIILPKSAPKKEDTSEDSELATVEEGDWSHRL